MDLFLIVFAEGNIWKQNWFLFEYRTTIDIELDGTKYAGI